MELPTRKKDEIMKYDNIACAICEDRNTIRILLDEEGDCNYQSVLDVLNNYKGYNVTIGNVYSVKALNNLIRFLNYCDYDGNVRLNVSYPDNTEMKELDNYTFVELLSIPDYVKIRGIDLRNKQDEFTTWGHNLSNNYKSALVNHLTDECKDAFLSQENLIDEYAYSFSKIFKVSKPLTNREKFEIVFNSFKEKFVNAPECLDENGKIKSGMEWGVDSVETFERRKGLPEGRSNLLTLLTNNNYLGLKCVTVNGKLKDGTPHTWNQFIDDDGTVLNYDLSSSNVYGKTNEELTDRTITREYPVVKELTKKTLPKKKVYKPVLAGKGY